MKPSSLHYLLQSPAARAVPPSRKPTLPPPPPPAADTDSEYGSAPASDDGVKVEAEESEPDEVDYADVETPEEAPPPVPLRTARAPHRQETLDNKVASPPLPPSRPPVPTSMPESTLQCSDHAIDVNRRGHGASYEPAQNIWLHTPASIRIR